MAERDTATGTFAATAASEKPFVVVPPSVALPKGGGAIRGIGEKFATNPVTGTGTLSVPLALSPGRSGFGPSLALAYDTGAGNSPYGFGWELNLPAIRRKTDKGLPRYEDATDSDTFTLSDVEDLVPEFRRTPGGELALEDGHPIVHEDVVDGFVVRRYRPRVGAQIARIERWTRSDSPRDVHWRSITADNVLTLYGQTDESRIADPERTGRIFAWLVDETRDDRGNAILYRYKAEDSAGADKGAASEANRSAKSRTANRYLKRIHYGNRKPLLDAQGQRPRRLDTEAIAASIAAGEWLFEVVFDYGDHDDEAPVPTETRLWALRPDPFSTRRPGFEVRTSRLCRRVLMFHHFDKPGVGRNTLVRSMTLEHSGGDAADGPGYSYLRAITQSGHLRKGGGYLKRNLPRLEFGYSAAKVSDTVGTIDPESLENLPAGIDGGVYQWVDLDGDGVAGILTEQAGQWYYKRNLSPLYDGEGRLGPVEQVADRPGAGLSEGVLVDLSGDGQLDLLVMEGPAPGIYEREKDGWGPYRPFADRLNRDLSDPELRFIDLDGDGRFDLMLAGDDRLTWHPALGGGEAGFGEGRSVGLPLDEENGPRLLGASNDAAIHLADMTGDGLADLVKVTAREVCYWPNLGYGRFGPKVTMDRAPDLSREGSFDPRRIVLADIDGSGTSDIIHLDLEGPRLYFNLSGNGWSKEGTDVPGLRVDDAVSVAPIDLFGNGTVCLVWSSPLLGEASGPLRYVDLMGGTKPHLLTRITNNLGAETTIQYASSSRFYLKDLAAGRPWITSLPFPVNVVDRVETRDKVSDSLFVSTYAYRDGFFDGAEREFRGFGMVEQWDTEQFATLTANGALHAANEEAASHVPPVHTKTWFHTGAWLETKGAPELFTSLLSAVDKGAWYAEPGLGPEETADLLPPEPESPEGLDLAERAEAARALKGMMLRREVYADDGSQREGVPYEVTTTTFAVRCVQPRGANRYAVFMVHAEESLNLHYERNAFDPRMSQELTLEVDDYGNVLKSCSVAYGRRAEIRAAGPGGQFQRIPNPGRQGLEAWDWARQTTTLVSYGEDRLTVPVEDADTYRGPVAYESLSYELTGFTGTGRGGRFRTADFVEPNAAPGAPRFSRLPVASTPLDYLERPSVGRQRRLIEHVRTLFRSNDLSGFSALGTMGRQGLVAESYQLAMTPKLLAAALVRKGDGQPDENLLPDPAAILVGTGSDRGGYVLSTTLKADGRFPATDADGCFWRPSGRNFLSPLGEASPAAELAFARSHFFLPCRSVDPFGATSQVSYDEFDLMSVRSEDAVGNVIEAACDYRVLQPTLLSDPNGNRSAARFDALGFVVGTAVMGKADAIDPEGDSFEDFVDDPDPEDVADLFASDDPAPLAAVLLGSATTRLVHDFTQVPPATVALARETHVSDLEGGAPSRLRLTFSYSDGFGREVGHKMQAEPGVVPRRDADGHIQIGPDGLPVMGDETVGPRWVSRGWTIFNNKGSAVRSYESWFTDTHRFEPGVPVGVSAIALYDPLQRVVGVINPDHSWTKTVFDAWSRYDFDAIDTLTLGGATGPAGDADLAGYVAHLPANACLPTWHGLRTAPEHAAAFAARYPDADERVRQTEAAVRSAALAGTPLRTHSDVLGRGFLAVADKGPDPAAPNGPHHLLPGRVELDIEGNVITVRDALTRFKDAAGNEVVLPLGRVIQTALHDLLGDRLCEESMDAGRRFTLPDVSGMPVRAWDDRGHVFRMAYDALRRPIRSHVAGTVAGAPQQEVLVERVVYGEGHPEAKARNLRGRTWLRLDQAGAAIAEQHDFKGNQLAAGRSLTSGTQYRGIVDWSGLPDAPAAIEAALAGRLEPLRWRTRNRFDAVDRPIQLILPHRDVVGASISIVQPSYNEASLVDTIRVWLDRAAVPDDLLPAATATLVPVSAVDYDAKGRRVSVAYGCGAGAGATGVVTSYRYDPLTFSLQRLTTRRDAVAFPGDAPANPPAGWPGKDLQDLSFAYDPVGNIAQVIDRAQQTIFFGNRRVEPSARYEYDALYRIVSATGREHLGQTAGLANPPTPHRYEDSGRVAVGAGSFATTDGTAMGAYTERYTYDDAGNLLSMQHTGSNPVHPGWTRTYSYREASRLKEGGSWTPSNRLTASAVGGVAEPIAYDGHGNMLSMPQLGTMSWDYIDQLAMTARRKVDDDDEAGELRAGERTYYVYDAFGERVRKVTERPDGSLKDERIYVGGAELFVQHAGVRAGLERETLHIEDGQGRVASIETRNAIDDGSPKRLVRYQFHNHLGSASLELDETARIISYEEYTPYGSTSYQAVRGPGDAPKRYRFTGKERDEESGLYYSGARYYAPWLARWTSCDPIGLGDGPNIYIYARCRPVILIDPGGTESVDPRQQKYNAALQQARARGFAATHGGAFQSYQLKGGPKGGAKGAGSGKGGGASTPAHQGVKGGTADSGGAEAKGTDPVDRPGDPAGTADVSQPGTTKGGEGKATGGSGYVELGGPGTSGVGGTGKGPQDPNAVPLTEMDYTTQFAGLISAPLLGQDEAAESVSGGIPEGRGPKSGASAAGQALYLAVNLFFTFASGLVESGMRKAWAALKPYAKWALKAPVFMFMGAGGPGGMLPKPRGAPKVYTSTAPPKTGPGYKAPHEPSAPVYGNPQNSSVPHAQTMQEKTVSDISRIEDAKEVFMHTQTRTVDPAVPSRKLPDMQMVSQEGKITFYEVPSPSDIATNKAFAKLLTRNLKVMRAMGGKSEGLVIIPMK
ncbi:hypothetical protein AS026_33940 [Rhizobium altiplani]|uniref:Toxin n=1 Tax=Rhizobium altiplani TaxID=1864509 RepID=A0A109JWT5_9HYPH|nr:SpvB/TcaC N-terminal domain-containing protein [Rhizobium altiplani]KWV56560.1 hypothetical protein AS026_33940 [Rhizobium altiplani]